MIVRLTFFAALVAAAPYALHAAPVDIVARFGSTCSTDGALVCNANGSKYAICAFGHATFQSVAAGTVCACAHGSSEQCTIAATDDSAPPSAPAPPPAHNSPKPHQSQKPHHSTKPHSSAKHNPSPKPSDSKPAPAHAAPSAPANYQYKTFLGNGSPSHGWPTENEWLSFDTLWERNQGIMSGSCSWMNQANDSPAELAEIKKALLSEAKTCGVDPRLGLAQMLQESGGCVRVHTTNYGVRNPGLFQSHNGVSCHGENPCPDSKIKQMVHDGLCGTQYGLGLKGVIQAAGKLGDSTCQAQYAGMRIYNSGSVDASGLLQNGIATHCYVFDIANRLLGWNSGTTGCTLDQQWR